MRVGVKALEDLLEQEPAEVLGFSELVSDLEKVLARLIRQLAEELSAGSADLPVGLAQEQGSAKMACPPHCP